MLTAAEKQTLIEKLKLYEGNIPHMYLDTEGLVTVGIGNLLRTVQDAQKLSFLTAGGQKASKEEISTEYNAIKKLPKGQLAANYKRFAKLHLDNNAILSLVKHHIDTFYKSLSAGYPGFTTFPSEVKLALLDMGFNLGVNGLKTKFPNMNKAIAKKDWQTAAKESHRKHPVSEARNNYVKELLEKAAQSSSTNATGIKNGVKEHGWRKT